ncbi:MAG: protein phosphatase 2C domain-containing protein [Cyanobacteria bacterium]|nr:protein phosphatase 2C domain-containing protein [Cyanobacteriota bacterium]MDW8199636.1 protein phosphatase 2C domain-containing protein [Cyanobacteriota bacterium SKYGB_h_bin112]
MNHQFQLAAGSITGRDHLSMGKNNQDAMYSLITDQALISVVCDGCGSCAYSEVGARLIARLTVTTIARHLQAALTNDWASIRHQLLTALQTIVTTLGGDVEQTVRDYFLCTIVGVIVAPENTVLFSLGDGIVLLNGQLVPLGMTANNTPPYLAYGLLEWLDASRGQQLMAEKWAAMSQFQCHEWIPTSEVASVLIGSDGVLDLIKVADRPLPGKSEAVGQISQFWEDDRYFENPDRIRRRLFLINREATLLDAQTQHLVRYPGLLPDDTTFVVIRSSQPIIPQGANKSDS